MPVYLGIMFSVFLQQIIATISGKEMAEYMQEDINAQKKQIKNIQYSFFVTFGLFNVSALTAQNLSQKQMWANWQQQPKSLN